MRPQGPILARPDAAPRAASIWDRVPQPLRAGTLSGAAARRNPAPSGVIAAPDRLCFAPNDSPKVLMCRPDCDPANALDDAVPAQPSDRVVVEAEPVSEHLGGMLAQQRRRFDFGRDA